jgi:protein-S-isoprenylcysteine O-methyltransferase Ste14
VQQLVFAWLATGVFAASLAYFLYSYLFTFGVADPASSPRLWRPLLVNFVLFSLFAVHHSLFARTPIKRSVAAAVSPALERAVYTLIASVLFLLVCGAWRPLPGVLYALSAPWRWAGYAVQFAGVVMTITSSRALDVLDLSGVRQVLTARSTGVLKPHRLETGGVYGLVRHPLYFGWALFVFGAPDMTLTRFSFAVISTAYLALAIPFEERSLVETYGGDYLLYKERVRWKMLPGIY